MQVTVPPTAFVRAFVNATIPDTGYGFGWGVTRYRKLREISHGGGLNGFRSFLLRMDAARCLELGRNCEFVKLNP
jgi:hypothetical protein